MSLAILQELQAQKNGLAGVENIYQQQRNASELRIDQFLKKNNKARVVLRRDGTIMALVDVSPYGVPIYIKSDNAGVATSLGVDELRVGGSLGLNLEGAGIQIGIWDEGRPRLDHVEYVGRVTQIDNPSAGFNFHSSHVLGTMIASGINPAAKGMAPKATAIAFDFFSDVSEMIGQAKPDQSSIILSNHSYGTLSGWDSDGSTWTWHGDPSISNTRDWKFGFYNNTSNLYDDIAFNAPYYLIVKSAGNDNADVGDGSRPPDCDPFDCIPTNGVAKNVLTVGAVKKLTGPYTGPTDVVITDFSSFGPTDDGRIKPDIVAPGQAVFSTTNGSNNSYGLASGTSMSSPATTGTLVLLQELHKNLNGGSLMKSATLKALAIHTAREAGTSPGPDFRFGWGLLDAEAAAKTLIDKDDQNIFIKELSLNNGDVFEMNLEPKQNTKITATLVWTDPAGPVLAPSLNPTAKMLRNDLDLRLVDDGGTTQFPWVLNATTPATAASKGDNLVDNIEKLEFDNPEPRNYKLRVSHKGTLVGGKQDFSLIINYTSVVDPRVTYYWIGNSGDWDNGANWSLSSGGAAANAIPTADDKVVFDKNSFSTDNQTVSLTQDQQAFSLRWFANEQINLSFNNHQLTMGDEINFLSDNISSSSPGTIFFNGTPGTDANINLNNNNFDDLTLEFSGLNSKWILSGDFSVDQIELIEGDVTIGANSIKSNSINSSGVQAKKLTFSDTEISGVNTFSMDVSGIELEGEGAIVAIPAASVYTINLGDNHFNGTLNLSGGEVNVMGNGEINEVKGFGTINISGNNTWNNFSLGASSVVQLEEATTQKITDAFQLDATVANRVTVKSLGSNIATLEFEAHHKICLDHLDIENVVVTGEATVNAGLSSTIVNSPGWLAVNCNDILFPDFDIEFNCEKAAVFFVDKSTGPISERSWDFGDAGSLQNKSTTINPIHYFEGLGDFEVTLGVSDGQKVESYSKIITLEATVLPKNKIEISNGRLISFLPANKYQWVLNNELLPNTNLRSIDFSNGLGLYAVLTFDENCNRQSDTFLVTGLDELKKNTTYVYPNPASEVVNVRGDKNLNFRLVNGLGQELRVDRIEQQAGWSINVSNLPDGIYILQIRLKDSVMNHRVMIKH